MKTLVLAVLLCLSTATVALAGTENGGNRASPVPTAGGETGNGAPRPF